VVYTNPFLAEPTPPQQLMLDSIGSVFLTDEHDRWPSWAYLEEVMERDGFNAEAVLASMPRESTHNYGWVWPMRASAPSGQDQVGLTIAGLKHIDMATVFVRGLSVLIGAMGTIRAGVHLDPFTNQRPRTSVGEIVQVLHQERRRLVSSMATLLPFLTKEPATWNCEVVDRSSDDWIIELSPVVRRFAGVNDVDGYLERLATLLASRPLDEGAPEWTSPFTLPAAIDYLDAVWRLKFSASLVVPPGIERSARLAFDIATIEEADSALSALAEVIKCLQVPGVPGVGGHPLQRLGAFLSDHVGVEAMPRVEEAVGILNAARCMRASAQHVGAQPEMIAALGLLGLPYPVANWPLAWMKVQSAVAYACDTIRQEVHALL
jgi:hypothetical protein